MTRSSELIAIYLQPSSLRQFLKRSGLETCTAGVRIDQ